MNTLTADVAHPADPERTAARGASTLGDFFRYHGIWAPGVRMFRRLGFRAKALVISATFILPIVTLGWSFATLQNTSIEFSAKERLGVSYAQALLPLLPMVQQERQAAALGSPAASELAGKLDAQRQRLAQAEAKLGAELGTGPAFAAWTQADRAVASAGSDPAARNQAHAARVDALLSLLGVSTDGSNLTLDPDIDTYYLMDTAMFRLPAILESLAQLRATGAAVLKASQATPAQQRLLIEQRALLDSQWAQLDAGLKKALIYNSKVKTTAASADAAKAWAGFADKLESQALRAEGPSGDAAAYLASGDAAQAAMLALADQASRELDTLVQARVDRLRADSRAAAAMVVLALLLAAYLFYCFHKVLDGGIREVAYHVNAMRDGNLTTRPRAWGADELATLMGTLTEMQQSMRIIVSQVRSASDTLVQTSVQMDAGAAELSDRTVQTAANLEQTAAAMEQVAATVKNNEGAIQRSSQLASNNASLAEKGGQIVGEVVGTMQSIHQSSGRIAEITGTIDSIAFQTNILALNAAVEAARAGDQGRGFAVVASEVRALAQRSAGAAREIKALITASLQQIDSGAKVAHQAGTAIGQIVGAAAEARSLLGEAAQGAREQSIGIDQSAQAVQSLDRMTQHNAALVDQTAAAARALKDQAVALSENVARFRLPA